MLTIHKVMIKVRHSFVFKIGRAVATFFKFNLSHSSATIFYEMTQECYIYL